MLLFGLLMRAPQSVALLATVLLASSLPSFAQPNQLVIADFQNTTGDDEFNGSLKQALTLELEQSPLFYILPDGKTRELLQTLGHSPGEPVTENLAREICLRTGGKAVTHGEIASATPGYTIDIQAKTCDTGLLLARSQGKASQKKQLLQYLSRAAFDLREQLGESHTSVERFSTPILSTTNSLAALKKYSDGLSLQREQGDVASASLFKQAVALDSHFPLAYSALAGVYRNQREPALALKYAAEAYRLRAPTSKRVNLRITSTYFLAKGDTQREIETYREWENIYPHDFTPHNNLGNAYFALGKLTGALKEYQEAVHITPTVASYSNVMGAELSLNLLDEAQLTFDQARAQKLDGRYVRQTLYWLSFLRRDNAQMEQQVRWASGKAGDEDMLLSLQSDTEAYFGRLTEAREFTRRAVASAMQANSKETAALWQTNSALREAELKNLTLAKNEATAALNLSSGRDVKLFATLTFARVGETAEARRMLADLVKSYPTDTLITLYWIPTIRAAIQINLANPSQALKELDVARPYELGDAGATINYLYPAWLRGQAYLLARNPQAAVTEFQKLIEHPGIVLNFVTGALVHLQLGRAYAQEGQTEKAKAAYQTFFDTWKDAQPDASLLREAHVEYTALVTAANE